MGVQRGVGPGDPFSLLDMMQKQQMMMVEQSKDLHKSREMNRPIPMRAPSGNTHNVTAPAPRKIWHPTVTDFVSKLYLMAGAPQSFLEGEGIGRFQESEEINHSENVHAINFLVAKQFEALSQLKFPHSY